LVYARAGNLLAVPFDVSRLQITGTPMPVLEGIPTHPTGGMAYYTVSDAGTLVYEEGVPVSLNLKLATIDRSGTIRSVSKDERPYGSFSISPDGKRVAAHVAGANDDIWIYEPATGTASRFTFEPGDEVIPRWT